MVLVRHQLKVGQIVIDLEVVIKEGSIRLYFLVKIFLYLMEVWSKKSKKGLPYLRNENLYIAILTELTLLRLVA
jgi:hypothetical protein